MDLRQFLLDAPETCFYTSYDLILIAADGTKHQLADFYEIGDVADVTAGGCSLEMVSGNSQLAYVIKLTQHFLAFTLCISLHTWLLNIIHVAAFYDDRSIRNHLRRTRDLLSSTNIHSSLSTTLAMENDSKKNSGTGRQLRTCN
jgi:protein TIF31